MIINMESQKKSRAVFTKRERKKKSQTSNGIISQEQIQQNNSEKQVIRLHTIDW